MSIISVNRIQHWLDTPIGEVYGYPSYGNNLHELLFINRQNKNMALGVIINKLKKDLGDSIVNEIKDVAILSDNGNKDTLYVAVELLSGLAIGEVNAR